MGGLWHRGRMTWCSLAQGCTAQHRVHRKGVPTPSPPLFPPPPSFPPPQPRAGASLLKSHRLYWEGRPKRTPPAQPNPLCGAVGWGRSSRTLQNPPPRGIEGGAQPLPVATPNQIQPCSHAPVLPAWPWPWSCPPPGTQQGPPRLDPHRDVDAPGAGGGHTLSQASARGGWESCQHCSPPPQLLSREEIIQIGDMERPGGGSGRQQGGGTQRGTGGAKGYHWVLPPTLQLRPPLCPCPLFVPAGGGGVQSERDGVCHPPTPPALTSSLWRSRG